MRSDSSNEETATAQGRRLDCYGSTSTSRCRSCNAEELLLLLSARRRRNNYNTTQKRRRWRRAARGRTNHPAARRLFTTTRDKTAAYVCILLPALRLLDETDASAARFLYCSKKNEKTLSMFLLVEDVGADSSALFSVLVRVCCCFPFSCSSCSFWVCLCPGSPPVEAFSLSSWRVAHRTRTQRAQNFNKNGRNYCSRSNFRRFLFLSSSSPRCSLRGRFELLRSTIRVQNVGGALIDIGRGLQIPRGLPQILGAVALSFSFYFNRFKLIKRTQKVQTIHETAQGLRI